MRPVSLALILLAAVSTAFALNPPTDFSGSALSTGSIHWGWTDAAGDEDGYFLADNAGGTVAGPLGINTTFYIESGLDSNILYRRRSAAFKGGDVQLSNDFAVYTHVKSPTSLSLQTRTTGSITLQWDCADKHKSTSFRIDRSTSASGDWAPLTLFASAYFQLSYTDAPLPMATTFFYRVWAYNAAGVVSSTFTYNFFRTLSSQAVAVPLEMVSTDSREVTLRWNNYNGDYSWLSGYNLYRSSDSGATYLKINDSLISKGVPGYVVYVDSGIEKSKPSLGNYSYKARGINLESDEGPFSNIITTSPPVLDFYLDIDGDGHIEVLSRKTKTYTDPNGNTAALFMGDLTGLGTYDAIIDTDGDGKADKIWLSSLGIVSSLAIEDIDGDGIADIYYDSTGAGTQNRYFTAGQSLPVGTFSGSVINQWDIPVSTARVDCIMAGGRAIVYTDLSGAFGFTLKALKNQPARLIITKDGYITYDRDISLVQGANSFNALNVVAHGVTLATSEKIRVFPNPVKLGRTLNIIYAHKDEGPIRVDIYDSGWGLIKTLVNEYRSAGVAEYSWNLADTENRLTEPGLYYCVFRAGQERKIEKIIIAPR